MSRWENDELTAAIDAQLLVLHAACDASRADLMAAEQQVVAHMHDDHAHDRMTKARAAVADYTAEIKELQDERRQQIPAQRPPA
jgi:hypothetical protein